MKKVLFMAIGLCCLTLITGTVFVGQAVAADDTRQCYTVAVRGPNADSIPLANVTVKSGDCVIFLNQMKASTGSKNATNNIKIAYTEGTKCMKGVQMSVGFAMDPKMCFASGWLRRLETATIVFSTPGVYNYEIRFESGAPAVSAKVTVE
jgi:hypothetical protein